MNHVMDSTFYVIAEVDSECYLRVHYFSGRVHYRFDADDLVDARLFKNRIEAISCYTALVEADHPGDFRVFVCNAHILAI